jgi:sulfiredoxin
MRMIETRLSVANRIGTSAGGLAYFGLIMMKREIIPIADIYVPIKRRATLDRQRVDEIAGSILDRGLQAPILVRTDGARFVLVEGLHRLEAAKALGEESIAAFLVDARKH